MTFYFQLPGRFRRGFVDSDVTGISLPVRIVRLHGLIKQRRSVHRCCPFPLGPAMAEKKASGKTRAKGNENNNRKPPAVLPPLKANVFFSIGLFWDHHITSHPRGICSRTDQSVFTNPLRFSHRRGNECLKEKRGYGISRNPLISLVGTIGFEPTTSTVSG
jgi:hypothetical protein